MTHAQSLAVFAQSVYFTQNDIKDSTRSFYLIKIGVFSSWLCRTATLADLVTDKVNRFLEHRLLNAARDTVRGERAVLVALWNSAHRDGLIDNPPTRIRPVKKTVRVVSGWDEVQLVHLLEVCKRQPGEYRHRGVERATFWRAVVLTLYDTGMRVGDLLSLDAAQLRGPGTFSIIQNKTGRAVECSLSEEAWEAIKATHPKKRKKPFGDMLCRNYFFEAFARICDEAGLEGRTRQIRKASGSLVERENPGRGHEHLGNTRQVFDAHYHCRDITKRPAMLPPRLPPRCG